MTDVIGAAVVGHWFTPARRNIPNPGEWIKVDGADVALVDGKASLRFMEPMEEVNYIDQLRLLAVDHFWISVTSLIRIVSEKVLKSNHFD